MSEITAALDEKGANKLFDTALASIGPLTDSGTGALGPTIRIVDLRVDWAIDLTFGIDLSFLDFCLPQVCVDIPCVGEVCTPTICFHFPTISVHVPFSDFLKATIDFGIDVSLTGGNWKVQAKVLGVPSLGFGASSAALLLAIGAAATPVLLAVPFIGPLLAIAVDTILALIAVAGVTNFLGPIITPFVSGLKIPVYEQPQLFTVLPVEGPFDPKVDVTIDTVSAVVAHTGTEDELVLGAAISA